MFNTQCSGKRENYMTRCPLLKQLVMPERKRKVRLHLPGDFSVFYDNELNKQDAGTIVGTDYLNA